MYSREMIATGLAVSLSLVKMDDISVCRVLCDCLMLPNELEQPVKFLGQSCTTFFVDFSEDGACTRCFATA